MPVTERVDLASQGGRSDKVYHIGLDGSNLQIAYGRRGSGLNISEKIFSSELRARQEMRKICYEKLAKGYEHRTGVSGNVFGFNASNGISERREGVQEGFLSSGNAMPRVQVESTPVHRPQLLNEITEDEAEFYLSSELWGAQEKKNGRRHSIIGGPWGICGSNKLGKAIPAIIVKASMPDYTFYVDGESIGCTLYAFDLLQVKDKDLRSLPYIERYIELCAFVDDCDEDVELVPLFQSEQGKRRLFKRVKEEGGEGLVFKLLSAPFTKGRPNSGGPQLKMKFWAHTQAKVVCATEGKRSVLLACWDALDEDWIDIGRVTIPANYEMPSAGDIVEIRYLYFYHGGSLFQPQFEGVRTDCVPEDCDISKLKRFEPEE